MVPAVLRRASLPNPSPQEGPMAPQLNLSLNRSTERAKSCQTTNYKLQTTNYDLPKNANTNYTVSWLS